MVNQSSNVPNSVQPAAPGFARPQEAGSVASKSTSGLRATGTRRCPNCGTQIHMQTRVCPECGENLQTKARMVRCRRCGQRSHSELVLCGHCGRELQEAPPRALTWGAPLALVLFFLLVLAGRWNGDGSGSVARVLTVAGLGERVAPEVAVVMTPIPAQSAQDVAEGTVADTPAVAEVAAASPEVAEAMSEGGAPVAESSDGVQEGIVAPQPGQMSENAVSSESVAAAESPGNEDQSDAVDDVSAVAEAGVPGADTEVSDTSGAGQPVMTPSAVSAPAGLPTATATTEKPTPLSPTPTPTATPALTPEPTETATEAAQVRASSAVPTAATYEIRAGDTLVAIASRLGIRVEDLMRANNINANDAFTIQPGQTLLLPVEAPEAEPTATATPVPTVTDTPRPRATTPPTATATATKPAIRLDAPVLRSPENGTPMSCSAQTTLVWLGVPFVKATDKYVLHVGYVDGYQGDGTESVTWLLAQHVTSSRTSWELDGDQYCQYAKQQFGRRWRWWVEVAEEIDGVLQPVSPPSVVWGFTWN